MIRIYHYDAVTNDEAQRRPSTLLRTVSLSNGLSNGPSALLRAVSLSNGIWTSYEAFTIGRPGSHSMPWKTLSIASESSLLSVSSILAGLDLTPTISFEISIFWLNTFLSVILPT